MRNESGKRFCPSGRAIEAFEKGCLIRAFKTAFAGRTDLQFDEFKSSDDVIYFALPDRQLMLKVNADSFELDYDHSDAGLMFKAVYEHNAHGSKRSYQWKSQMFGYSVDLHKAMVLLAGKLYQMI